jgi:hypothetical protein
MERHPGIQASAECDSTMQPETFFISSLLLNRRLEMKKALKRGRGKEGEEKREERM